MLPFHGGEGRNIFLFLVILANQYILGQCLQLLHQTNSRKLLFITLSRIAGSKHQNLALFLYFLTQVRRRTQACWFFSNFASNHFLCGKWVLQLSLFCLIIAQQFLVTAVFNYIPVLTEYNLSNFSNSSIMFSGAIMSNW